MPTEIGRQSHNARHYDQDYADESGQCCQVMSIVFALFLSTGYNVRYVF